MNNSIPSQNLGLLENLIGKKIISVQRQLFKSDMDLSEFEQKGDGPVEFTISDGSRVHFFSNTEAFSVGIASGAMSRYGDSYEQRDVSKNSFWAERLGQEVKQILLLKAMDSTDEFPGEFGVELFFSNGTGALIEYRDEENYPDMIQVSEKHTGGPCVVRKISH
ncbi:hypothetical protein [Marinobacter sp. GH_1]|uniref:hypothetical protein n=1 Tax=Marinobacter sp. GH_1 TaxID=3402164 RepID=UPI003B438B75|tara:strand:+ start:66 stop:557 length:492 start_codon:yes stop_codon:yes gene_type:complete